MNNIHSANGPEGHFTGQAVMNHQNPYEAGRQTQSQTAATTTTSTTTANPSTVAQPRQSCTACRARKIKCNKALPDCAQCVRAGTTCYYAKSQRRGRPRNGTTPTQPLSKEAQLEKRVKQLEAIIASIRGGNGSAPDPDSNDPVDPLEAQLGKLVVGKPYHNDQFFDQLKEIIGDSNGESDFSEDEDEDIGDSPQSSNQDFILGQIPNIDDLSMLHPPVGHILAYWHTYLENCESFLRLVHTPTMSVMVHEAIKTNLSSLSTSDELLLFCFYFAATTSVPEHECLQIFGYERDDLLQRYQIGIKHALARAKFMHSQDFKVLQGLVLYLVCVKHSDDGHGAVAWTMCGLAIRLAQAIGVDRDGTLFGLSPLETEMRRRVWWQLLLTDLRASEGRGSFSTLLRFDTQLPVHLNDADLTADMTEYPPTRKGPCDMTISLVRLELAKMGRRLQGSGADDVALPLPQKRKMIEDFSKTLSEKYYTDSHSNPALNYSYRTACLVTSRMNLMIFVRRRDLSPEDKDWLFQITIDIMEHYEALRYDTFASRWSWLLKTQVQWHAIAFALAELCVREPSALTERAWTVVEKQREEWLAPADSASMTIYTSVRKLLSKAERHRRAASQRSSQESSPVPFHLLTPPSTNGSDDTIPRSMLAQLHGQTSHHNMPMQQQVVYNWVDSTNVQNMQGYQSFTPQWPAVPQEYSPRPERVPSSFFPGPPMVGSNFPYGVPEVTWPWDQVLSSQDPVGALPVPNYLANGLSMPEQQLHPQQWNNPQLQQARREAARIAANQGQHQNSNWNG